MNIEELPVFKPVEYRGDPEQKSAIPYGRYLVVRKDGHKFLETFNGSGWAYNDKSIVAFYLPKVS